MMKTINDIITREWDSLFRDIFKENYSKAAPDANHIRTCRGLFLSQIKDTEMESLYYTISPESLEKCDTGLLEKMRTEMVVAIRVYERDYK